MVNALGRKSKCSDDVKKSMFTFKKLFFCNMQILLSNLVKNSYYDQGCTFINSRALRPSPC